MPDRFTPASDATVHAELVRLDRLHAIAVLLADPQAISDPLESELYAYREVLNSISDPGHPQPTP